MGNQKYANRTIKAFQFHETAPIRLHPLMLHPILAFLRNQHIVY